MVRHFNLLAITLFFAVGCTKDGPDVVAITAKTISDSAANTAQQIADSKKETTARLAEQQQRINALEKQLAAMNSLLKSATATPVPPTKEELADAENRRDDAIKQRTRELMTKKELEQIASIEKELKSDKGFDNLTSEDRQFGLAGWAAPLLREQFIKAIQSRPNDMASRFAQVFELTPRELLAFYLPTRPLTGAEQLQFLAAAEKLQRGEPLDDHELIRFRTSPYFSTLLKTYKHPNGE